MQPWWPSIGPISNTPSVSPTRAPESANKPSSNTRRQLCRSGPSVCASASVGSRSPSVSSKRVGPLIYALLQYDFFVLYPINPATLAKYRQAFSTAHGKDDPSDADYLLDLFEHHRDRLRPWHPDDQKTCTLRLLVEQRRRLTGDRTRISNRLTALLKGYFPQVLDWFEDIRTRLVCDFLERWPKLSLLQQARPATIDRFLC